MTFLLGLYVSPITTTHQLFKDNGFLISLYGCCDIKQKEATKEFLSSVIDMVSNLSAKDNKIRDDQSSLLALACAIFWEIPTKQMGKSNMAKYLHFFQETTGHAR